MKAHRWQRIQELFHAVRPLAAGERAAYLDRSCDVDPELRREVESLLASESLADDLLEQGPGAAPQGSGDRLPDPSASLLGRRIGVYRLERVVASGGMGTVYLAKRDDAEYEQRVAVKLIKRGIDTAAVLQRFHQERQVLALLEHPNIARLLDGGTSQDGLPYLVMEHVDGREIDDYCDDEQLGIDRRLGLILDVCDAVSYAHGKLIVHRDIKPANILVTAEGIPKLLDFGIAKILEPDPTSNSATATTQRMLTPDYASPEQVRGDPISTASDVYSLGVTLYELLTGHRPYRVPTGSPRAIEEVVCEREPTKPSSAVMKTEDGSSGKKPRRTPEDVARVRSSRPERLRRQLAGDLDTILLKALRKEPAERYGSVSELADDIRRQQTGLPVLARRPTLRYRASKFVRRHRRGVAATLLVLVSVLAGATGIVHQSRRARAEARLAERVLASMDDLLGNLDPMQGGKPVSGVRDVLDRSSEFIVAELADAPDAQCMVAERIARVYAGLGEYDSAVEWQKRALAIREGLEDESPRIARALHALGEFVQHSDPEAAETTLRRALEMRKKILGLEHPGVAETIQLLSRAVWRQGRTKEGESLAREALALRRRAHRDKPHRNLLGSMLELAIILQDRGDYAEAERLLNEGIELSDRLGPERDFALSDVTMSLGSRLGGLLHDRGRYNEAEPYYRAHLEWIRGRLGNDHPRVAPHKISLALLLKDKGDFEAAESLCREGLESKERHFGKDHAQLSEPWFSLAKVLADKGDLGEAERAVRRSLELGAETLGQHPMSQRKMTLLARTLVGQRRYDEAEPIARESLRRHRETLTDANWKTAKTASILGAALAGLERYDEAETLLLESYPVIRDDRGPSHPRTRQALERIVFLYLAWDRPDKAQVYRELIEQPDGM